MRDSYRRADPPTKGSQRGSEREGPSCQSTTLAACRHAAYPAARSAQLRPRHRLRGVVHRARQLGRRRGHAHQGQRRSPPIRKDAVRSPEVQKDAVRSPEIQKDAVRTSEIRNEGIKAADVSTGAATALRGDLHVAEEKDDDVDVPECDGVDLRDCPNLLVLPLASGATSRTAPTPDRGRGSPRRAGGPRAATGWSRPGPPSPYCRRTARALRSTAASSTLICPGRPRCSTISVVTEITPFAFRVVTLSGVLKKSAGNQTVALRCTSPLGDNIEVNSMKMTAQEVGAVTGP